jgi:pimeloyl-ACP methyl ester carboxylesterase
MGCGFSDNDWQSELEAAELACYAATPGIDLTRLERKYTFIEMNGQTLAVRTIIYNDDRTKKTLLMTHGYCMASVYYSRILPALAEHYRIVMFDNLGWGLNSRTDEVGDALESPEKAEAYTVEWWRKFIEALGDELPPKFYLSGHSAGGAMCMMYASAHPERIEGMFLQSPASIEDETSPDWVYDPYTIRLSDTEDVCPSRSEVDKMIANFANNVHI